jgi:glutathione synthase/RimK-type ligase-like ATP-grasp enzyme
VRPHVAVFSFENDLHALAVRQAVEDEQGLVCHVVETDRLCDRSGLNWSSLAHDGPSCTLPTREGTLVDVASLDAIWWRRPHFPQQVPSDVTDPVDVELINNECLTALSGVLLNEFSGVWINHPVPNNLAANKLVQLRAAAEAGFRIPRTLVSQDPLRIKTFCSELDGRVVVKRVRGTTRAQLFTGLMTTDSLASDETFRLCPTMYQEYVRGRRHLRAHCFGDEVYAALIESDSLDWRDDLSVPFSVFHLADDDKARLLAVVRRLGLEMGVIDLKLTDDGPPIWLEINPQGQFLFVEALCDLALIQGFSRFLAAAADRGRSARRRSAGAA